MAEVNDNSSIQLFEDQKIRTAWDAEKEEWYFSIVDVVAVLTEQKDSRSAAKYWSVLKVRLKNEGSELTTNCSQLKMKAADGKRRLTDVANTEQLLRIIQSIPSKKAEPFKAWLAMVGKERIEETIDPEQAIDRALDTYLKKGYSEEWIHQRLLAIRIRNELTDNHNLIDDSLFLSWRDSTRDARPCFLQGILQFHRDLCRLCSFEKSFGQSQPLLHPQPNDLGFLGL